MKPRAASTYSQSDFLKPFWTKFVGPAWLVSLGFYALVAAVRFFAFFSPYEMQHVFFLQTVAMWMLPFLFLTPRGRDEIGLTRGGGTPIALIGSAFAGAACGLILFRVGMAVYGFSQDNWCISIRNYLHIDDMRGILSPAVLFALYAVPAVCLNPIGEELLFRGFIQQAFSRRFGSIVGTAVSSILSGAIYLYLHGLWRDNSGFHFRFGSIALAVGLMFGIGVVFTLCRKFSRSLWAAMVAHAAFNLALLACEVIEFAR